MFVNFVEVEVGVGVEVEVGVEVGWLEVEQLAESLGAATGLHSGRLSGQL